MKAADFAAKVRRRETIVGTWVQLAPRLDRAGRPPRLDYVSLDAQHGLFGY